MDEVRVVGDWFVVSDVGEVATSGDLGIAIAGYGGKAFSGWNGHSIVRGRFGRSVV